MPLMTGNSLVTISQATALGAGTKLEPHAPRSFLVGKADKK